MPVGGKEIRPNINEMKIGDHISNIDILTLFISSLVPSLPMVDSYWTTGKLSCGNKLPNGFLD